MKSADLVCAASSFLFITAAIIVAHIGAASQKQVPAYSLILSLWASLLFIVIDIVDIWENRKR